jgi:hypothetical protein
MLFREGPSAGSAFPGRHPIEIDFFEVPTLDQGIEFFNGIGRDRALPLKGAARFSFIQSDFCANVL